MTDAWMQPVASPLASSLDLRVPGAVLPESASPAPPVDPPGHGDDGLPATTTSSHASEEYEPGLGDLAV